MDKSFYSSAITESSSSSSTTSANSNGNPRDDYLKHLNKLSHKISKPTITRRPAFDEPPPQQFQTNQTNIHNHLQQQQQQQQHQNQHQHQHQPPVYNINKSDFRDVVQKLTGSPAHERIPMPPPLSQIPAAPKPQSSRLQRIRPPPLSHLANRPPPPLMNNSTGSIETGGFVNRSTATPLSPLPPLPSVHTAAESPISAYMRFVNNSLSADDTNSTKFGGFYAPLVSPRWYGTNPGPPQQQQQSQQQQQPPVPPPQQEDVAPQPPPEPVSSQSQVQAQAQFQPPASPLPFGCLSPRSSNPLLSPGMNFSSTSGQLGFPLSPTVPMTSPRYKGL